MTLVSENIISRARVEDKDRLGFREAGANFEEIYGVKDDP